MSLGIEPRCELHSCELLTLMRSENERVRLAVVEKLLPTLCRDRRLTEWIRTYFLPLASCKYFYKTSIYIRCTLSLEKFIL